MGALMLSAAIAKACGAAPEGRHDEPLPAKVYFDPAPVALARRSPVQVARRAAPKGCAEDSTRALAASIQAETAVARCRVSADVRALALWERDRSASLERLPDLLPCGRAVMPLRAHCGTWQATAHALYGSGT